jgi:sortase A
MRRHLSTIILIIIFFAGLSLLLYPSVANYWNSLHQTRAIASYADEVANLDDATYQECLLNAYNYNDWLYKQNKGFTLSEEDLRFYESQLDVATDGTMGYIEIPSINCVLPIYHGTSDATLQSGVGHLAGSSLPVGGESTHCVLSGHRGLPSAKLFTNLDQLSVGDVFYLRTLDETLTYEVDQILIVEPDDVSALGIEEGMDYCTLVTCTPYGVNTHRLLVRGHRIENIDGTKTIRVTADALQIEPMVVAPFAAIPLVLAIVIWVMIGTRKRPIIHVDTTGKDEDEDDDEDEKTP